MRVIILLIFADNSAKIIITVDMLATELLAMEIFNLRMIQYHSPTQITQLEIPEYSPKASVCIIIPVAFFRLNGQTNMVVEEIPKSHARSFYSMHVRILWIPG